MPLVAYRLPSTIFRYVVTVSWPHQIALSVTQVKFLVAEMVNQPSESRSDSPVGGKTALRVQA
jgi:hypothetical protein